MEARSPTGAPEAAASVPPSRPPADSGFETSALERSLGLPSPRTLAYGWRRRALIVAALLGCLGIFSMARWLAATPQLAGHWVAGAGGELMLAASEDHPALAAQRGRRLLAITAPGLPELEPDALLLHRSPRWQVDDVARAEQVRQHQALAALLRQPQAVLHFEGGGAVAAPVAPRGYAGLGLAFWPLAGLAMLLYLCAVVVLLARPKARNLLFMSMALCQAGNLLLIAIERLPGLGMPPATYGNDMLLRVAFDLATCVALAHAFLLHPLRFPHAQLKAAALWAFGALFWAALASGKLPQLWWWAQGMCIALGALALAIVHRSYQIEANPYAFVMRRLGSASLATLVMTSTAVVIGSRVDDGPGVAASASIAWYLFFSSLLLLTPFLSRSRQILREFAMLAGLSTVATSLDLLFVAVFSLGTFTSLAVAVFIALALYAGARQWLLQRFIGTSVLTTERTFDQLYRAAREVQSRPGRYPQLLAQVLRELFEPLEVARVERVPARSRLVGGGSALVVPLRTAGDDALPAGHSTLQQAPAAAIVLRFARRGQRLFTLEDARLADRVVDQLRRAVAYDQAVERGRHEERLRIAQDLHDDIGARLLTLMYQAQSPEMEDYIRHTLQDLKTLTRGLAAAEHRFSHAAAEWKADLTQRLTAAHVALGWTVTNDQDRRLSVVQWSALTRVLRELVTNALYHGHASRIDVQIVLEGNRLLLQVADDGRGRDPKSWSHGLGLGGVRKRVKLLGGEVAWHENTPRGIVCVVRVAEFGRA